MREVKPAYWAVGRGAEVTPIRSASKAERNEPCGKGMREVKPAYWAVGRGAEVTPIRSASKAERNEPCGKDMREVKPAYWGEAPPAELTLSSRQRSAQEVGLFPGVDGG